MKEKALSPVSFRPWPEIKERLDFAHDVLGLEQTALINEVLAAGLKPRLEAVAKKKREELAAPVP